MDCILFDADKNGDNDLLVTCGDMQYEQNSIYYKPRLYINDSNGNFTLRSFVSHIFLGNIICTIKHH